MTVGALPATLEPVSGSDGYLMIRRVGSKVMWALRNLQIASAGTHFLHPQGFRTSAPGSPVGQYGVSSVTIALFNADDEYQLGLVSPYASSGNGWAIAMGGTGGAAVGDPIMTGFETDSNDTWPSTLPGTQFSAPVSW